MAYVSFESFNFPDRFIRHQNFLGELSVIQSDLDRADATFLMGGPAGQLHFDEQVRLSPVNFPRHVLRHQDFRIKLHEYNPGLTPPPGMERPETLEERLLREDSLFIVVPALSHPGPNITFGISFKSFNYPNRFIRHRDFHLFVEEVNDDVGRKDASFIVRGGFAPPPVSAPGEGIR